MSADNFPLINNSIGPRKQTKRNLDMAQKLNLDVDVKLQIWEIRSKCIVNVCDICLLNTINFH